MQKEMSSLKQFVIPSSKHIKELSRVLVWKNYLIICISMWFFLTAQFGIGGIQSSVLKEGGIGLASQAVYFGIFGPSALIIPQILINKITFKWTLNLGYFLQLFYIAFNAYPKYYTYLPVSAIGGFGAAQVFVCSGYGISKLCEQHEHMTKNPLGSSQALFFGIFGVFYEFGGVIGNLLIAVILRDENSQSLKAHTNFSYEVCGKNFCPNSELPPSSSANQERVYVLIGAVGFCAILSFLVGSFLNDINFGSKESESAEIKSMIKWQLKELKRQVFQLNQLLVVPLNLLNPFLNTIFWADFTRSYAACSAGLDFIGWTSMTLNGTSTIFAPIFGKIASKLSIQFVLGIYYSLVLSTGIYMLFWSSGPSTLYYLFILSLLLGLIDSINSPQPRALYGTLFNTEVVYSVFTFLQGVGFLAGFLLTQYVCTNIKLYVLLGLCTLCILCDLVRNTRQLCAKRGEMYKEDKNSSTKF